MYFNKWPIRFFSILFLSLSFILVSNLNVAHANDNGKAYDVSPGVYHQSLDITTDDGKQFMQMLEVDLNDPDVTVLPYAPQNQIYGPETVGNTIQELRDQNMNVVAGTNGDFFSSVGVPSGLQITNGEVFTSPRNIKAAMLIFPDDTIRLDDGIQMMATMQTEDGEELEFNMVNRSRVETHSNHAFLFNYRFGETVKTPEGGLEVAIDVGSDNDQFYAGQPVSGEIMSVNETADSAIERGTFIVSAVGEKAEWIEEKLEKGDTVEIEITYNKDVNEAEHVLSGNSTLGTMLLKDGEIVEDLLDLDESRNTDKHPRTMIATKEGKLYMVAVDGRQPGHSEGMTLPGAAEYLQSLGMTEAINIDGGGSTTYYVREPGEASPNLLNKPSDLHERPVGNSLVVVSQTTATDQLSGINLFPSEATHRVVVGSDLRLTAKGYDESFNQVVIDAKDFDWSIENDIGSIDQSGLFTAGDKNGTGNIVVSKNGIEKERQVVVTDDVARLEISPQDFIIEENQSEKFLVKAYDQDGNQLTISPHLLDWTLEGDIGEISKDGVLKTGTSGSGKVLVEYKGVQTEANVTVGESPMIERFEDDTNIRSHEVRTVPGSVELSFDSDVARFGEYAGKLVYDFTGTPDTSAAYVEFLNDEGEVGQQISGKPEQFGLWVYGDEKFHWLRLGITDAEGDRSLLNLTTDYGINWTGWKYVYATVPEDAVHPITLRNIAIEEKNKHNKTAGGLYYDNFHAIYKDADHNEDIGLLIGDYIDANEIQEPLADQLTDLLIRAKAAFEDGSKSTAEKEIDTLLALLDDSNSQDFITADARTHLKDEIDKLLESDVSRWQFTIVENQEDPTINDIHALVTTYIDTGDIRGPLQNQLANTARQAGHHYNDDRTKQAIKFMDKFLKQLNKSQMQKHITADAKETLEMKANRVLNLLKNN